MGTLLKWIGGFFVLLIAVQLLPKPPSINQAQTEADILKARKEAEDRCPDPAKCREANRKAYAAQEAREKGDVAENSAPAENWNYISRKDLMRGTDVTSAYAVSSKQLEFDFPYNGGSDVTLWLTKREGKTQVMLQISKGQFICYEYSIGELKTKFDSGKILSFACGRASDGDTTVIFVTPANKFIENLRGSKKLIVEATFYGAGTIQIPFSTSGLKWK